MKGSPKNLEGVLKRLFPSASVQEMETAGDRVLNRLRGQLPERVQAFRFSPGGSRKQESKSAKTESLRPIDQVCLQAIYLTRDGGYSLDVFMKAQEVAQNEISFGSFYSSRDRLERRGLITKEMKEHKGRVQAFLKITELGERVLAEAVPSEQEATETFGYFA